ncbi:MAG: LD-carboxypeptidase [Acidimicrobiales bacterium]
MSVIRPPRLQSGDRVRLVSPASTPDRGDIELVVAGLRSLGLVPEVGDHAFDVHGYLAGTDDDRLADLNQAFADPGVRAVIATRGGKGAYRIADRLDVDSLRRHPKLLIGFSEITVLHLALFRTLGLVGLHGAAWASELHGAASAASFERAVFSTDDVTVAARAEESTSALTTSGRASGRLIGGNQDMVAISSGWALPSLDGAILLLEAVNLRLGHIDRQLTMLTNSGALDHIVGVAVGQYTRCGPEVDETIPDGWEAVEVLRDRLERLGVPILGGLPIGHGSNPVAVPLGTTATIDADPGTLVIESAVS